MLTDLVLAAALIACPDGPCPSATSAASVPLAAHTYEARIRLDGRVSTTRVQASDAGQAKKLVQAQYGPKVTVLSVKRVD
jgi:hypothetical protein